MKPYVDRPSRSKKLQDKALSVILSLITGMVCLAYSTTAWAQENQPVAPETIEVITTGSVEGKIIDSIIIENLNVFDTREEKYDNFVFRMANRLHVVTRPAVIRRELLFKEGDKFHESLAEESARNLRVRSVIYDALIVAELQQNGHVRVRVRTIDQWSLLGGLRFRREGNETEVALNLGEKNFLGYNQYVSLDYNLVQKDRDHGAIAFRDPRILGYPYQVELFHGNDPVDKQTRLIFERPFYNLAQNFAFSLLTSSVGGRRDIYTDSIKSAQSYSSGQYDRLVVRQRWGSEHSKFGVNATYLYRYQHTDDRRILNLSDSDRITFPEDSVYHQFGVGPLLSLQRYATTRRIAGFGYTEDIALGLTAEANIGRAFSPDFEGAVYDQYVLETGLVERWNDHLFSLQSSNQWWVDDSRSTRRRQAYELKYYFNRLEWLTVAARFIYEREDLADGGELLILGGRSGLRGYDTYFRTGSRMAVSNLELRFFPGLELLSTFFGAVVFLDVGGVAEDGDKIRGSDLFTSVGVGLRISFERVVKSSVLRLDVARTQTGQVEVVVGSNQAF